MLYWLFVIMLMVSGCGGVKPPPPPPDKSWYMSWKSGLCNDTFVLYQRMGDGWIKVGETTNDIIKLPVDKGEEIEFTIAGVCSTGENQGEWRSGESLVVKR